MPTYDYACEACGHEFEHFQSMSERRLAKCPKCKKSRLVRKVGGGAGVIFKGSGFYATDYRKSSPPASAATAGAGPAGCGKPECGTSPGTCAAGSDGASTTTPKSKSKSKASPE
jgi:putative FmdB family regulatory protein